MLPRPAEKYRKLIQLFSQAVRTATQIRAYFGSLIQLMSRFKSLLRMPMVGFRMILKIIAAPMEAMAIGRA